MTAKAGYTPPPVPPADTNSRNVTPYVLDFGCLTPGHVEQQAHGGQGCYQARSSVAEERKGVAGEWQQPQEHGHVDHGFNAHPKCDAARQEHAQPVTGFHRDSEATPHEEHKQGNHQQGAHKSQLLAGHGEDAVGVRRRQQPEFLTARTEAPPEQPPGCKRLEGMLDVVGGLFDIHQPGHVIIPAGAASGRDAHEKEGHGSAHRP